MKQIKDPAQELYEKKNKKLDLEREVDSYAMWGFILSLFSIYIGFVSLLALILSIIGLSRITKDNTKKGKGFAIAGIVISCIVMLVMLVFFRSFLFKFY